ncbi:hypothetical protein Q1695_007196 [Nippostrongylus brasiliensis]|nr:hypothetical protein Q1695_007196 [Nippostrongylus brasiliensis]
MGLRKWAIIVVIVVVLFLVIVYNSSRTQAQPVSLTEAQGTQRPYESHLHQLHQADIIEKPIIDDAFLSSSTWPDPRVRAPFLEWKTCVLTRISEYEHDARALWSNLSIVAKHCEQLPFMKALNIRTFHNKDEGKRHILPLEGGQSVIVTVGVGMDTRAEEALRKVLPKDTLFYGADPVTRGNEELYSKIGTFLPFAVGGYTGITDASVLETGYVRRTVVHIDLVTVLNDIINKKFYDALWIDSERAEYKMLPLFHRDGRLDQNNITLCQLNLEAHRPNDEQREMFRAFVFRILQDNRYAFFRLWERKHLRMYFLNFANSHCVSKYIVNEEVTSTGKP